MTSSSPSPTHTHHTYTLPPQHAHMRVHTHTHTHTHAHAHTHTHTHRAAFVSQGTGVVQIKQNTRSHSTCSWSLAKVRLVLACVGKDRPQKACRPLKVSNHPSWSKFTTPTTKATLFFFFSLFFFLFGGGELSVAVCSDVTEQRISATSNNKSTTKKYL